MLSQSLDGASHQTEVSSRMSQCWDFENKDQSEEVQRKEEKGMFLVKCTHVELKTEKKFFLFYFMLDWLLRKQSWKCLFYNSNSVQENVDGQTLKSTVVNRTHFQ